MNVYTDINDLPVFEKAVITTGSFDGVHTGHLKILQQLITEAEKIGGTPVLITFYPHPKQVVEMKEKPLWVLNTPNEKYELLQKMGIKNIVVVPFDKTFSALTASEYIEQFLVKTFKPAIIVVGYDHRFGHNREGNFDLLQQKSIQYDYEVREIPEHVLENVTISSTKIRDAISFGNIERAQEFLGYSYFLSGHVVEGNRLGRTLGYPTANIDIDDEHKLLPAKGVYAVDVQMKNVTEKGMMNIGIRPTINGKSITIEVHIFNFNQDIYGEKITVILKKRLRNEVQFEGLDKLKEQLAHDKLDAMRLNP